VSAAALDLFSFGQREAESRGLLLVDTKYEFGRDADGNILLVDEVRLAILIYFCTLLESVEAGTKVSCEAPWARASSHAASRNVGKSGDGQPLVRAVPLHQRLSSPSARTQRCGPSANSKGTALP